MNIGDRLKDLRQRNNMTLEEVGIKIGTTKQTLYKYENSIVTNIPSDKIEALAKIYGTTPAFIMGWEDKRMAIPVEFQNIGIEWMMVAQIAKESGLSPEDVADILRAIKKVTDVNKE